MIQGTPEYTVNGLKMGESVTERDVPAFQPKPFDWAYLQLLLDAMASRGVLSDTEVATRLGCTRVTVWRRKTRPGFQDWLNGILKEHVGHMLPKILMRCGVLAMRGSIDHMKLLFQLAGRLKGGVGPGDGGHGTNVEGNVYQINTLIPRPDGDGYVVRATKTVKY